MSKFPQEPTDIPFLLALVLVVGASLTASCLQDSYATYRVTTQMRQEAVKAGAAIFTVNPETGETKFEWINCEKQSNLIVP